MVLNRTSWVGAALYLLSGTILAWAQSPAQPSPTAAAAATATPSPHRLDQLITQAIQAHPSIANKRAGFTAAQSEIQAARYQYYPTPSVQLRQDKGDSTTIFAVQQPLWAAGRLDAGLDAASARSVAASAAITEAQTALALRVTSAWQAWYQAKQRSVALLDSIEQLKAYAQSAARRIEAGAAGEGDRALVDARLAQTQGDLAAARAAERSALAQLSQMVGEPLRSQDLHNPARPAPTPAATPEPLALEALLPQALKASPALQRAQAEIDSARHEITQKRAALWPTLNLRAEHQSGVAPAAGLYPNETRYLLVLDYTPGAGLSAGANADAASARLIGLQDNLEATQRDVIEKVSADFEEHQSSRSRVSDLQRTFTANAEVLASYERLFIAGKRGWLEVINAARELTQAQTALADVQALHLASATRLRLHAGELLGATAPPQPTITTP